MLPLRSMWQVESLKRKKIHADYKSKLKGGSCIFGYIYQNTNLNA